eukprot:TRINITY_DN24268_c0_g1_i1.p2 TRINITY_DN24268_c0_g1~~TRINITY_DN24268_c0_g1_i1.p2  ORF type:complete len:120 (+),score=13.65 TRINITY_DN24268_c0_g1_i1:407-766(+)
MEKEQRTEKKEKERKENSFHELWQRLPTHQIDPVSETEEEKTVRQSIQVWYGINGSGSSGPHTASKFALWLLLFHYFLCLFTSSLFVYLRLLLKALNGTNTVSELTANHSLPVPKIEIM